MRFSSACIRRVTGPQLAKETPASFVAFDLLALDGRDLKAGRRASAVCCWKRCWRRLTPPIHLTPATDRGLAIDG